MTTARDYVAEEVRAMLARRRLSARAASRELGWTPMYLSRRMTGAAPFTVDDIVALADLLDVPVTCFFEGFARKVTNEGLSPKGNPEAPSGAGLLTFAPRWHARPIRLAA